jgi:aldose 1-epimerase
VFSLKTDETELVVSPEIGGSISAFRAAGRDVLRPTPPGAFHPLQTSSFPLVPWVNRVAGGRFTFDGTTVSLPAPIEGERHALHGHGWVAAWTPVEIEPEFAALTYRHRPSRWPWGYEARQTFSLEPGRLTITLAVANLTDSAMPLSLGFHPYFESPARLSATVDGVWHTGEDLIPDRWDEAEPFRAHDVDMLSLDNTFTGWDRRAVIDGEAGRIAIASDVGYLHIFAPKGRSFFCLEPVSAAPDAFNHPERGMQILPPGAETVTEMKVSLG